MHLGERVAVVSVEPGVDHEQLGAEGVEDRLHDALHEQQVVAVRGAGSDGDVHGEPLAAPDAALAGRPGVGKEGVLVERNHEDARVLVERPLRAVAVVDVVIDDRDAPQAGFFPSAEILDNFPVSFPSKNNVPLRSSLFKILAVS